MNKDEYAFLPEAFFGGVQEQEDEEELDPYFRPDAVSGEDEPDSLDWMPETPTEPCPCCGAEIPENPSWGYICPMCGWEIDYDVEGEPDKPSDQNHGLSLTEARWNFHSFGTVAPWKVMENGE
ncbi:MAG: CPCC family cysteine-rich protein [Agathobaculum butyriciproducens]|nr:CPCC family cysteine-rich protein [Agathobaculum butyriciproducens]